jgi:hypothetical protein
MMAMAVGPQVRPIEAAPGMSAHIIDMIDIDSGLATAGHRACRVIDNEGSAQLAPLAIIAPLGR